MYPACRVDSLQIAPDLLQPAIKSGSWCYVARSEKLTAILEKRYQRSGLCLKVCYARADEFWEEPQDYLWGHMPLYRVVRAQNLIAWHGLAPRVYAITAINGQYPALVTDWVEGKEGGIRLDDLLAVMERYDLVSRHAEQGKGMDMREANWRAGKLVDTSSFYCLKPADYVQSLVKRAYTWQTESGQSSYEAVPELGITGARDTIARLKTLRLQDIQWWGATVLDIGCNMGGFCREAYDRGARRAVGVDTIGDLAFEVNNWLGYWQCDFLKLRLPGEVAQIEQKTGIGQFDVILHLAAWNWAKWGPWIKNLLKPNGVLLFEGHGGRGRKIYEPSLSANFVNVKYLGVTTDSGTRHCWRCRGKR